MKTFDNFKGFFYIIVVERLKRKRFENHNKVDKMDELSLMIMNGNYEGIKEYHRKKVNDAFNNGVFVGKESVRDAVANVLGFTTGKE